MTSRVWYYHCQVHEREMLMKRMDQEKQYFQRELVNRETNFNKVFNSDPKVGVLNPFEKKVSQSALKSFSMRVSYVCF